MHECKLNLQPAVHALGIIIITFLQENFYQC